MKQCTLNHLERKVVDLKSLIRPTFKDNERLRARVNYLVNENNNLRKGIIGALGKGSLDKVHYWIEHII